MLTISVELWMYKDMVRANLEKYCIYNGERKFPLKKEEFLGNDKDSNKDNNNNNNNNKNININNRKEEKNKSFRVVA